MNSFRTFRCLTVISVVHMVAQHVDTQVAVVVKFFVCMLPRHVSTTRF